MHEVDCDFMYEQQTDCELTIIYSIQSNPSRCREEELW